MSVNINNVFTNNVTANGNSKGAPCVFPFFYNGSYHDDCVSFDRPNRWCSTTDNYTRDGQWGECLNYDVCQCHNNLSDAWRNIGFNLSLFPDWQIHDLNLQEGWYRFSGIGGDRMAYYCLYDILSDDSNDFWLRYSEGSANLSLYTCNASVTDHVQNLDCGAGLILYYLVPITGVYRTCHVSCNASSCGLNAPCNSSDGSCVCNCDNGLQTINNYSACRDYCGIAAILYDMLDMDTNRLLGKVKKKDKAKTNNDINNTFSNTVQEHAMVVGVNGSKLCLTREKMVNGSDEIINDHLATLIEVIMPVGLLFLSLTLLTFVLCGRQLNVTNTAQVNLCINLLLAHILYLIKGRFLTYILANQVACAVLAGFLHFLFLSSFVWMFIDAVLLFISAKNLTKIRSRQKKMLGWKYLTVIGYAIPLLVVGVSVAAVPDGYSSRECWLKSDRNFDLSLWIPMYFILAANVILFIAIFITVTLSLKRLNSEILQGTQTQDDKKLIRTVLFKTMAQFFILGCPWTLRLFIDSSIVLEIIFVILISQQGTVIFLVHCALNQEVRQQYKKWLRTYCPCKKASTANNDQMTEASGPSTNSSQH
ncbi:hypothetical protein SRHO_G00180100 [Serrasalmus rhombeus]